MLWACLMIDAVMIVRLQFEPLEGETISIKEALADSLTLVGCSGSKLSQPMVDGWLEQVKSLTTTHTVTSASEPVPGYSWHLTVSSLNWHLRASEYTHESRDKRKTVLSGHSRHRIE